MEETILHYFEGRSLFITGCTGFMGKVLLEKLLRSCAGIKKIYVLIRSSKKGSLTERLKQMTSTPLFDRLKSEKPDIIETKVQPIEGNITELGLGISPADRKLLTENVSVVIHAAASVRFDDPINEAIIINLRGTREVVNLVKELKNLSVFLHISTTYCNCTRKIVEEKVYSAPMNWKEAIYIAENTDRSVLNNLGTKFLGNFPNSYVFSKNLTEQMLKDECQGLPVVIFRPSIVIATAEEPVQGWIDTFMGPVGLIVGIGKGVIRCVLTRNDIRPDYMPVDVAIKGIIIAIWKKGYLDPDKSNITVYNGSSGYKSITMRELMEIGMSYTLKYPYTEAIWTPSVMYTTNKTCFYVNTMIKQVLPAVFLDAYAKFSHQKSWELVRLQRRVYSAALALSYFMDKKWLFINANFVHLLDIIPKTDKENFDFNFEGIDPAEYLGHSVLGGHKYLLKTDLTKLPAAARRQRRLNYVNSLVKVTFWCSLIWFVYNKIISYVNFYLN